MKEPVAFAGVIVGQGRKVECKVRATKTTLDEDPSAPATFSEYRIMKSSETNVLPEGDYAILTNGKAIKVKLQHGRFIARS
jgi:hypothetical protein